MKTRYICAIILFVIAGFQANAQVIVGPSSVEVGEDVIYSYDLSGGFYPYTDYYWIHPVTSTHDYSDDLQVTFLSEGTYSVTFCGIFRGVSTIIETLSVTVTSPSLQAVEYTYDACGNRIARMIVTLSSDNLKSVQTNQEAREEILEQEQEAPFHEFRVYPNPTTQTVFINLNDKARESIHKSISLFDLSGKQILRKNIDEDLVELNMDQYPNAIYILRLEYDNGYKESKIIKQ